MMPDRSVRSLSTMCNQKARRVAVLEVEDLHKRYGEREAVGGISFTVEEGEIFGILGPNGAGKTSTLETLEGRAPTAGVVRVMGVDVRREPRRIRELVGVQLQATSFLDLLTVREILELFGSFYRQRLSAEELMRRVDLALAMVNDPRLLFLDEPHQTGPPGPPQPLGYHPGPAGRGPHRDPHHPLHGRSPGTL